MEKEINQRTFVVMTEDRKKILCGKLGHSVELNNLKKKDNICIFNSIPLAMCYIKRITHNYRDKDKYIIVESNLVIPV